jgi:predicted transposase/invertase (TIGR01784 family)
MQVVPYENLEERIVFYWSKMYTSQISSGQKYTALKKTVVILFTDHCIEKLNTLPKAHTEWQIREKECVKFLLA